MKTAITVLVFCVCGLLALGLVMLYSASMTKAGAQLFLMQLTWCGIGLGACMAAACIDYRWLKRVALALLVLAVVLLALVLVPDIGVYRGGARRWFSFRKLGLGNFLFQPSEFAKIALIIGLAWYAEKYHRKMGTFFGGLVIPSIMIGVVLGLIFVEPDRGTTILLGAVCGMMLLIAGVRWRYVIPPMALAVAGLAYSLWTDTMRRGRIVSWLEPELHKSDGAYQAWQSMVAFGSGGWSGLGLGNGRQKMGFVPEHHTDFIFSIIGEELGLIATMGVLAGFVLLVICGLFIAWRAPDMFGMLLGSGITFLIGLQALINIGVVTGALPNKGLPLPFISYGGSNLLLMLGCVGILLSIARFSEESAEEPGIPARPSRVLSPQFA